MTAEVSDLPAVDRPLPAGLSRAADRKRHPGRPGARRHARQHGDRGGQTQPAQPRPGRRRRAGRAEQAQARPDEHRAARPHADLQSEEPRRAGADLGCAVGDGAGRLALHPGRRRIDAPAEGHGVDRRRRAADADRHVRLREPHPGPVDHHRAVHRRPALSGAALAGDPAAAGPVVRHDRLPPRAGGGRNRAGADPAATTRSASSTASSRTCSASCAPRCARSRAWPRSARPPTRSTTTCATCCRRRGCCPTGWRAATTSARACWRRPSSTPSTARRGWRATPSNMCATGRRPSSTPLDLADLVDEVGLALQEQGEDSNPNIVRDWLNEVGEGPARRAPTATCSTACSSISAATPSRPARTAVTVRARANGADLLVDVADNGPGVPQAAWPTALPALRHRRPRRRRGARPRHRPRPGARARRRHRARRDRPRRARPSASRCRSASPDAHHRLRESRDQGRIVRRQLASAR